MKKACICWLLTGLFILSASAQTNSLELPPAGEMIELNPAAGGQVFEGIGAVSAGASSRLLIEYPERQRREVLDYLFKPHFGAGFQHLKVEIGGEVNSTDGVELTHERSRTDRNFNRGYEWWLMREAKRRNGNLTLDSLAWGAPGWLGGGKFYSQETADYLADFLAGARRVHHLDIDYTGIWNETAHNAEWIKRLRRTLDHAGLQHVGIVAADDYDQGGWKIVEDMKKDPELRAAVARVGVHYRDSQSPPAAQSIGCPLWSSEDGPWRGDWEGARRIAQILNRNYIVGRFTKTEIWSPVTAYYDTLPLPGSGVMRANEPWSGHYEVQPAVWAVAHTTQFAGPGWRYLDSACRRFAGGSSVALQSPSGRDLSVIIETMDAKAAQLLELSTTGWPGKTLHVWRTTRESQFERLPDLRPVAGKYSLTVLPAAIYSLTTTTTGQRKGDRHPPASQTLGLPYLDDFSSYPVGASPRLFADQAGVFEVQPRDDGQGNCLRQVLAAKGIEWSGHKDPAPESVLGDARWTDYTISVDARLEPDSDVSVLGRVSVIPNNTHLPAGYDFKVCANGHWELRAISTVLGNQPWVFHTTGETGPPLAEGRADLPPHQWYHLELGMAGDRVAILLDGRILATVHDRTHQHGQAGLGCDWRGAEFAHFSIQPAVH